MPSIGANGVIPLKSNIMRWVLFAVVVTGITFAIIYRGQVDAAALEQWVQDAGLVGPLVFMGIYAIATVLFLPGSVLTLAGGALFGPVMGTFYNLTGATIGAVLAFIVARYLASDWVEQKTGGKLKQLKQGVEGEGWRFVAFVRLVPLFPFNLLNYALGLTKIRLSHYLIATYIFMLPGAIAYTYLGYAGREAIAGDKTLLQLIQIGTLALALLATVAFLPRLIGRLRRGPMMDVVQLKQKLDQQQDVLVLDVRKAEDYVGAQGHIANSKNIPVEDLDNRLDEITVYVERPIAIVCRTDRRSAKAAQLLTRKGFSNVHVVKGGMTDWNHEGYEIIQ